MKLSTIFSILSFCLLCVSTSFAKIWTVDNNPANPGDFTSLQAAHNGAANGDTLYVIGSGVNYGNITLTKTLFIFGPGYFLAENPNTQAKKTSAETGYIYFNNGSQGSLITGLAVRDDIDVNVSNITIKRNTISFDNDYSAVIQLANNLSNILILQNDIWNSDSYYYYQNGYYNSERCIGVGSNSQNIVILNNHIGYQYTSYPSIVSVDVPSSSVVTFNNNVIRGKIRFYNSTVTNNILRFGDFAGSGNDYKNNIGNSTQFGTANGNQQNVNMSTVFVGSANGTTDGQWQLKSGSPAIGAGFNGVDCGIFGGTNPYVLSGIPNIPSIYDITVPASGNNSTGLPIQIKAKSHN